MNFVSSLSPLVLRDAIWSWFSGWGIWDCEVCCDDDRDEEVWLIVLERGSWFDRWEVCNGKDSCDDEWDGKIVLVVLKEVEVLIG